MPSTADAADAEAGRHGLRRRRCGRSAAGAFDVLMLGVGPDGHVASLFPGFPQLDVDDRVAVPVTGSPKPPPERISLTFAALNRSKAVWFLVSGEEKAAAVARALADGTDLHEIPAAGVTGDRGDASGSSTAPPPPTSDPALSGRQVLALPNALTRQFWPS